MRRTRFEITALFLLLATPLAADDVHLVNGRVFEDVIAAVEGESVRLYLPFGEIRVPSSTVERIERAETTLQEFESRRDALKHDLGAGASEWVELARWALERGLEHSARQAALEAARRDPSAEGLAGLMRSFGYVLDRDGGRWMPYEESLARRGYARIEGSWLSPEQQVAWQTARARAEQEAARAREAAEDRRLTRALVALAAAELVRPPEPSPVGVVYPWPVAPPPRFGFPRPPRGQLPGVDPRAIPIERRQPGSLFPIAPHPHHHGGVAKHHPSARPSDGRGTMSGG